MDDHLREQAAARAEEERHDERRRALVAEDERYAEDRCPHCRADGFENVGPGTPRICVECGYDEENGTLGVCPGGKHYNAGRKARGLCCDACYDRAPRDLPGHPRWRSERRSAIARAKRIRLTVVTAQVCVVDEALLDWLRANQT